jgi:transcriptional regulator with XRE-family HTH domain
MDSKYAPKLSRPAAVSILDQRKLKEFRKKAGLSLMEVAKLSKISKSTLSGYEHGHSVPPLHRLIILFRIYALDLFEIVELLRLSLFEKGLIKRYRSACFEESVTPLNALRDFMLTYSMPVNSEEK